MAIEDGKKVTVDYTGTLEDGTVFDASERHERPFSFTLGAQQVLKGFEDAVRTLQVGESTHITLEAEHAYGAVRDDLIQEVPREQLPKEAEVGSLLAVHVGPEHRLTARVTALNPDTATLDLNHPLAGRTLGFDLTLVSVE